MKLLSFFLVAALALVLRLYHINQHDLWFDELISDAYSFKAITIDASYYKTSAAVAFFNRIKKDPHSFFYYVLVYFYSFIFGGGKSLRIISVVFSTLSLGIFYRLSRIFFNRTTSLTAIFLMVSSPLQIWYAQEARGYMMSMFFAMLMIYFYFQAVRKNTPSYWVSFSSSGTIALLSSYYSGLLLLVTGLNLFLEKNQKLIKRWLLSILPIFIVFVFALLIWVNHMKFVKNNFWLPPPSLKSLFFTFAIFNLGYSPEFAQLLGGCVLFSFLFLIGAGAQFNENKRDAFCLLLFLILPVLSAYLISKFYLPVYIVRHLIILTPFYYLFVAKGITSLRKKSLQIVVALVLIFLTISSLINYYNGFILKSADGSDFYPGVHAKKDYMNLLNSVLKGVKEEYIIVTTDIQSFVIMQAYLKNYDFEKIVKLRFFFYPNLINKYDKKSLSIDYTEKEDEIYSLRYRQGRLVSKLLGDKEDFVRRIKRLFLVFSAWNKEGKLTRNSQSIREVVTKDYRKVLSAEQDGIFIEFYSNAQEDLAQDK